MSGARVQNIDVLREFRIALIKFGDMTQVALGDAEGEISKVVNWLGHEQQQYWQTQIRKRQEIVGRCKEAVRSKKLFKDSSGRTQSAVDEEKQLMKAQRNLEEAEQKLAATKRHEARLQKEMHMYKGAVSRLMTAATSDIPNAATMLNTLANSLDAYVNLAGGTPDQPTAAGTEDQAMARGEAEQAPAEEKPAEVDAAKELPQAPADGGSSNPPTAEEQPPANPPPST